MNIENLRAVQAQIRAHPERFDMSQFAPDNNPQRLKHDCGTAGCIAGWAAAMAGHKTPHLKPTPAQGERWTARHTEMTQENQRSLVQAAADFLGLAPAPLTYFQETILPANNRVVLNLFFAEEYLPGGDLEMLNADDAVNAIDALIANGHPTWPTFNDIRERSNDED